jgi:succinylarginine dihydrolase
MHESGAPGGERSIRAEEVNFDGLVGPTHNYAGLSEGNLASARNKDMIARPRAAALQGLAKMRRLMELGLKQGVLAPQERPNVSWLRTLGFSGSDRDVWTKAWAADQRLARTAVAASSMWAANAATVSPSADCADGRLHVSVANLHTMLHRAQEAEGTARALARIFPDPAHAALHAPLTAHDDFADEGAANHMRLAAGHGAPGVEIFVYGRAASEAREPGFPGRQTLEASQAVARRHALDPARACFVRQSRKAIDAGAFHNDVVAVAHENVLFFHADAFADRDGALHEMRAKAKGLFDPVFIEISADALPLEDAVSSYLFNSQLVRLPGETRLALIAPNEVRENNRTAGLVSEMIASGAAIGHVEFVEVRESMRNGGGPACLRLRIVLTEEERAAARQGFFLDGEKADALGRWIETHYREELDPGDLADPNLVDETQRALDELTRILPLGGDFYAFQRNRD